MIIVLKGVKINLLNNQVDPIQKKKTHTHGNSRVLGIILARINKERKASYTKKKKTRKKVKRFRILQLNFLF
jgi:hypothetical protein